MTDLISIDSHPVKSVLRILLQDKTTRKNIIWATNSYESFGTGYSDKGQMIESQLTGINSNMIQPRICKNIIQQTERTRKNAEVFTPAWICNRMNNFCDEEWFGYKNVFNIQAEHEWIPNDEKIKFPEEKDWKTYVDSRRLEITCGEAPYLVSRYDTATGEMIKIEKRIGILDRKLRVVNENAEDEKEWMKWTIRAFQSVYGYEYQGDNLLIARINLLLTFAEYLLHRWGREAELSELKKIANIIAWNIWQMDGLKGSVPMGVLKEEFHQMSLFEVLEEQDDKVDDTEVLCRIYDWRADSSILYKELKEDKRRK